MTATMKAAVIYKAGGPEVLEIESRPIPSPKNGEVLIRINAFGLNRSERFTRQYSAGSFTKGQVPSDSRHRSCWID
jgi:NADPH:quinone reductase-like Zn-dependent oxidoreductase